MRLGCARTRLTVAVRIHIGASSHRHRPHPAISIPPHSTLAHHRPIISSRLPSHQPCDHSSSRTHARTHVLVTPTQHEDHRRVRRPPHPGRRSAADGTTRRLRRFLVRYDVRLGLVGVRQRPAHRHLRVELARVGLRVVDFRRIPDGLADSHERMEQHHLRTPFAVRAQQRREQLDHDDDSAFLGSRRRVGMGIER